MDRDEGYGWGRLVGCKLSVRGGLGYVRMGKGEGGLVFGWVGSPKDVSIKEKIPANFKLNIHLEN